MAVLLDAIVEHFGYMKNRAEKMVPFGGTPMFSAQSFFHKGPERDYHSELTPEQIERFVRMALEKLGTECAHWLETGKLTTRSNDSNGETIEVRAFLRRQNTCNDAMR